MDTVRIRDISDLSFMSFWSINDELNLERLKAQLDELKEAGLNGVVFHPRYYPNRPVYLSHEYMAIVNALILYAKSIDMEFWIYDEDGWPSGTAGGKVQSSHPELLSQWTVMKSDTQIDIEKDEILFSFRLEGSKVNKVDSMQGDLYHIVLVSKKDISSLDIKAAEAFIEITHEGYKKELSEEAFEYVTGFFSDEVHFPLISYCREDMNAYPWVSQIGERYKERYNEDINPLFPLLFIDGEGYEEFRIKYWELAADTIVEAFYKPINDWCKKNGKKFTAHLKAEENPFFQIKFSGSCLQVLKSIDLPAIDSLERYPGNNYYPRMLHSIASQFGTGDCLCECMAGSGWGTTPEDFVNYIMWHTGHGIRNFVLHINQLRLKSKGIHDWPPSTPCHLNWKEAFPIMLEQIKQKVKKLPDYLNDAELLIVTPTRGIMSKFKLPDTEEMNIHDGTNIPNTESGIFTKEFLKLVEDCHSAGINYEFTEERFVEEYGVIAEGYLKIGNRKYNKVLIAKGCRWSKSGVALINSLEAKGISILLPKNWQSKFVHKVAIKGSEDNENINSFLPVQSTWEMKMPESNLLALEFKPGESGNLASQFKFLNSEEIGNLELICYDQVKRVIVNGNILSGMYCDKTNGFIYEIEKDIFIKSDSCQIELQDCENGEKNPVALIRGRFAVKSLDKFIKFKEKGIRSRGPFVIQPLKDLDYNDLISSGLPFGKLPITLRKILDIKEDAEEVSIKLEDIHADAARIYVDSIDIGWCWGPEWTSNSLDLKKGVHEVIISIYPSTYNMFGPHRHIDGDRHLVSPDQYLGIKNFADRPDAPEGTFGDYWNFVKFGISGSIMLQNHNIN